MTGFRANPCTAFGLRHLCSLHKREGWSRIQELRWSKKKGVHIGPMGRQDWEPSKEWFGHLAACGLTISHCGLLCTWQVDSVQIQFEFFLFFAGSVPKGRSTRTIWNRALIQESLKTSLKATARHPQRQKKRSFFSHLYHEANASPWQLEIDSSCTLHFL